MESESLLVGLGTVFFLLFFFLIFLSSLRNSNDRQNWAPADSDQPDISSKSCGQITEYKDLGPCSDMSG